jgi:prepilin-type N-terminal cleavage/methylation domain-containing protein
MVSKRGGFTLVEVMVAAFVLTAGMLGVAGASAGMSRMLARGSRTTTALGHARARIEQLRSVGCDSMADGSAMPSPSYTLAWTIVVAEDTKAKQIELVASYPTPEGTRADTLVSLVSCA